MLNRNEYSNASQYLINNDKLSEFNEKLRLSEGLIKDFKNDKIINEKDAKLNSPDKISKMYSYKYNKVKNEIKNIPKSHKYSEISKNSKFSNKMIDSSIDMEGNDNSYDNSIVFSPEKKINDLKLLASSEIDDMNNIIVNIISYLYNNLNNASIHKFTVDKSSILIDELITSFQSSHHKNIVENKLHLVFRISEGLNYSYVINKISVKMIINIFINNSVRNSVANNSRTILINFKKYHKNDMLFFGDFVAGGKIKESEYYLCISVVDNGNSLTKSDLSSYLFKEIASSTEINGYEELPFCKYLALASDSIILVNCIDKIITNFTLCIPLSNHAKNVPKSHYDIYQTSTEISFNHQNIDNRHLCNCFIFYDEKNQGIELYKSLLSNSVPHVVFHSNIKFLKYINEQHINLCIKCPKMTVLIMESNESKTLYSIRMMDLDKKIKVILLGSKTIHSDVYDEEIKEYNENTILQLYFRICKENEDYIEEQELKMSGLLYEVNDESLTPVSQFDKALNLAKQNRIEAINKAKERYIKKESHLV